MIDFLNKKNELRSLLENDIHYLYISNYIGNSSKPILSKAGAELILIFFNLRAQFIPVCLDNVNGVAIFECKLFNKKDEQVMNGYGCAELSEFKNKCFNHVIKIAKGRALVDAALTYSCLSDHFADDLENEVEDEDVLQNLKSYLYL
jgi:hypothetical protein